MAPCPKTRASCGDSRSSPPPDHSSWCQGSIFSLSLYLWSSLNFLAWRSGLMGMGIPSVLPIPPHLLSPPSPSGPFNPSCLCFWSLPGAPPSCLHLSPSSLAPPSPLLLPSMLYTPSMAKTPKSRREFRVFSMCMCMHMCAFLHTCKREPGKTTCGLSLLWGKNWGV